MTASTAGARFTVSVLDSAFIDIILGSLARADGSRVEVTTGDISTFVRGDLTDVLQYVCDVAAGAAADGVHVSVALSLVGSAGGGAAPVLEPVGIRARAHWSLLEADGAARVAAQVAREQSTYSGDDPYVTRLDGDLAAVLQTVAAGWLHAGSDGSWPATHVTIALNSPSKIADDA